jgi:hypothetical protein
MSKKVKQRLNGLPGRSLKRIMERQLQPVFALARYGAAAPKAFGAGASDWNRTSDLGLMSPTL